MLLDHADFALQEQAEDNLMVAFSWAWYNDSYTMAAKPIKSLELHYTMIQFLIKGYRPQKTSVYFYNNMEKVRAELAFFSVKDGAYFCYCAYRLRISRHAGFQWVVPFSFPELFPFTYDWWRSQSRAALGSRMWVVPTNTGVFLRGESWT